VRLSGYPASEFVLEGDIFDPGATFAAGASSAVEGADVLLTVSANVALNFEYWVEDKSAFRGPDYSDPNSSSSTNWQPVPATWQIAFPTYHTTDIETTKSFKIHVRPVGYAAGELVLEADLYDQEFYAGGEETIQTVDYAYDVFNQLVRRTLDPDGPYAPNPPTDTFFSHQDGQIVLQFGNNDALSHRYFWNPVAIDQLLADETVTNPALAGAVLWPLADHLGTIRDLASYNSTTNATTIENHRVYDSFGNLVSETNAAVDELFGYTGRLFDEATGLQNNLHRWYDAKTGRWTSEDPIGFLGGDENLYRYVGNQPVNRTDPTGLWWDGPPGTGTYGPQRPQRPGAPGPGDDWLNQMADCLREYRLPVLLIPGTVLIGGRMPKTIMLGGQLGTSGTLVQWCQSLSGNVSSPLIARARLIHHPFGTFTLILMGTIDWCRLGICLSRSRLI
jgi:RHS repeat-associated protein